MPDNIADFTVPLGVPEIMRYGDDITVVSYGSTLRVVEEACNDLEKLGMSIELIDAQTLLPFDIYGVIAQSIRKTNRVIFIDEDVPGGTTAYMLDQVFKDKELSSTWMPATDTQCTTQPLSLCQRRRLLLQTQRRRHLRSHL